jgi:hypothetical protein
MGRRAIVGFLVTNQALQPFGRELGVDRVFLFHLARRFQLHCELHAAFLHLYGLTRDEVDYVMDTLPVARRKDEKECEDDRTKLTILMLCDQMAKDGASQM